MHEYNITKSHDLGGWRGTESIDKSEHELQDWEILTDALTFVLDKKAIRTMDQHRRAMESLSNYKEFGYYERWAAAVELLLIEKGILAKEEIEAKVEELEERW